MKFKTVQFLLMFTVCLVARNFCLENFSTPHDSLIPKLYRYRRTSLSARSRTCCWRFRPSGLHASNKISTEVRFFAVSS